MNIMNNRGLLPILLTVVAVIIFLNLLVTGYPFFVILPFLKALFLVLVNVAYGYTFLLLPGFLKSKKDEDRKPTEIDFFAAFGVGFIFTTAFFFIASWLKLLTVPFILLYFVFPLPLIFILNRKFNTEILGTLKHFFQRPAVEYLVFLFPLVYAILPSSFYDTLAYHLGIPNLYLQNGGFIPTPQLFYANTFIYYEIATIPAVFAGDMVPRLFHLLMGCLLVWGIIDFAVAYWGIKKRYILLLTVVSMPMTMFILTAVKNDLPCAVFIFLGIRAFLLDKKIVSALFWGFAIGVKYTNIVPLAVFLLLQLFLAVKEKRFRMFFRDMIVFGVICLAIISPLLVKNYVYTGNPVFPFLHNTFDNKIQYWDVSRLEALKQDAKKLFYSFKDLMKFPAAISFEELGSGGRVGPLFLIFLPFLAFGIPSTRQKFKGRNSPFVLLGFALFTLLIGGYAKLSTRVWYIAFLIMSIYVALAYEELHEQSPGAVRKVMTVIFFTVVGFNVVNGFGLQEFLYRSHDLFTGKVGIAEYKSLTFPASQAFEFVNENTPVDARVLLVGEGRSYYLKRPYDLASGYDYSILKRYLSHSQLPGELSRALKAEGFKYIVFDSVEFQRLQQQYNRLSMEEADRVIAFLKQLPVLFNKEGVLVLALL